MGTSTRTQEQKIVANHVFMAIAAGDCHGLKASASAWDVGYPD